MPLYEFCCPKHGKFEKLFNIPLKDIKVVDALCPRCGKGCPKVFSTPNWKFSPFLDELSKGTII